MEWIELTTKEYSQAKVLEIDRFDKEIDLILYN